MAQPYIPGEIPGQPAEQVGYAPPPVASYGGEMPPMEPGKPKRTGLKVTLSVLGVLLVLCVGGGIAIGVVLNSDTAKERRATVSVPDQVAGLTKKDEPELKSVADSLVSSLNSQSGVKASVAAFYAKPGDDEHLVLVAASTGKVVDPGKELDDVFVGFSKGAGVDVTGIRSVPAGPLTGSAKCGTGAETASVPAFTFCAWTDHGSIGQVVFYNRSIDESAPLFVEIRSAVLHRT